MRSAQKAKRIIFIRQYISDTPELDENGLETGSVVKTYSEWTPIRCLYTNYHGYVNLETQGRDIQNMKMISFVSRTCPINMMTDIYVGDTVPTSTTKANHVVQDIKQSKNCFVVVIKGVDIK